MKIATLGCNGKVADQPFGTEAISISDDVSLTAFDALFVDMDAVLRTFSSGAQCVGGIQLLNAVDSQALLIAARRWRERIADFLQLERLLFVGWSQPPLCKVHTLQDIVMFSAADFLAGLTPRFECFHDPVAVHAVAGDPFSSFLNALAPPLEARCAVSISPAQPLLVDPSGRVCAAYVYAAPAHVLLSCLPAGAAARAAVPALIAQLLSALGRAPYSSWLPAWAHQLRLPGEDEAITALDQTDRDLTALRETRTRQYAHLVAIRSLKALLGGSPEQAAHVFIEVCRRRGLLLLRAFPDDAGAVFDLISLGRPVLFVFESPGWTEHERVKHCADLIALYLAESDEAAIPCTVALPTPNPDSKSAPVLFSDVRPQAPHSPPRLMARELIEVLLNLECDLDATLARWVGGGS